MSKLSGLTFTASGPSIDGVDTGEVGAAAGAAGAAGAAAAAAGAAAVGVAGVVAGVVVVVVVVCARPDVARMETAQRQIGYSFLFITGCAGRVRWYTRRL
jgi:hypothetical protein